MGSDGWSWIFAWGEVLIMREGIMLMLGYDVMCMGGKERKLRSAAKLKSQTYTTVCTRLFHKEFLLLLKIAFTFRPCWTMTIISYKGMQCPM